MDKNMHDRLAASEKRIKEIDELLLLPETSSDMKEFKGNAPKGALPVLIQVITCQET